MCSRSVEPCSLDCPAAPTRRGQPSSSAWPIRYAGSCDESRCWPCLHLKTAVTELADNTVLLNPRWTDANAFAGLTVVEVDPAEPFGANVVRIGSSAMYSLSYPRTLDRLLARGIPVVTVHSSELAKAEGALTCCSLLFSA